MKRTLTAGALLMMTSACVGIPSGSDVEIVPVHGTGHVCNTANVQSLVGKAASTELGAEALRLSGSGALRWIRPGDMVTMDYREDRLNIELDAGGRVRALRCG